MAVTGIEPIDNRPQIKKNYKTDLRMELLLYTFLITGNKNRIGILSKPNNPKKNAIIVHARQSR